MNPTNLDHILAELGITPELREACRLPVQPEETDLVQAEDDMFGRQQFMTEHTYRCWSRMKAAALEDGIELKLVSAYRSIEYQCDLIRGKLESGRSIEDILKANTIPGHSEHHTGRAIDLHAGDGEPLDESFENHEAFHWLCRNANRFDFHLSYPKDNTAGISYEPWHWCCHS